MSVSGNVQEDVVRVKLQPSEADNQDMFWQSHRQSEHESMQRHLQQASEPIITQTPVAWTVTERELRDSLVQLKAHRVLHFTEVGHVVMNTYRAWDRRRSHASLDKWKFLLYTPVA